MNMPSIIIQKDLGYSSKVSFSLLIKNVTSINCFINAVFEW